MFQRKIRVATFFTFQSYQLGFQKIEKDQIKINKCFQISDLGRFSETILQSNYLYVQKGQLFDNKTT